MAKKKRQKYVRIVKKGETGWAFKTELGFVIATFLVSFALLGTRITGNAVLSGFGETVSFIGAVLFVFGIVQAFVLMNNRRKMKMQK